jgi:isopenicillin-N epimerase
LAVIDHVTSNTAIVLPVQRLAALFHAAGASVLVDGAHAVGMLDLNLTELGADYYVRWGWADVASKHGSRLKSSLSQPPTRVPFRSNLHKWFCGCKGTAIFYVKPELQVGHALRPCLFVDLLQFVASRGIMMG